MANIKYFKARKTKRINNLSRAINKIDPDLKNRVSSVEYAIKDIKAGINDVTYIKDGVATKIRYDKITTLPQSEQSSLLNQLSEDRYGLRQERALEQLKEKGKISWQFKKSIKENNPELAKSIEEIESLIGDNKASAIKDLFKDVETEDQDIGEIADSFFQGDDISLQKFDFYRPGESGGFTEFNKFTYNAYNVLKGV